MPQEKDLTICIKGKLLDFNTPKIMGIVNFTTDSFYEKSRRNLEALKYADKFLRSQGVPPLIFQGRLNLLDRAVQEEGILDYCHDNGIGFISFSPLAQGVLTARYLDGIPEGSRMSRGGSLKAEILTPELLEYLNQLNTIATERGESLATMALSWILSQRGVTSLIAGARTPEQFKESLKCINSASLTSDSLPLYPHKVF